MFYVIREWFRKKPKPAPEPPPSRASKYEGMHSMLQRQREETQRQADAFFASIRDATARIQIAPDAASATTKGGAMDAMDSEDTGLPIFKSAAIQFGQQYQAILPWFMQQQGFIGYQNAAFVAQHWLVYKACATPVDDAIRNGFDITTVDGEDIDEDALKAIKRADRKFSIAGQLRDFGTKGRIFGVRIALFEVESDDPDYYVKPYNPDGVKPGSYKGISQIDPYWTAPILNMESAGVPTSKHFYEPTWWLIGSRRVHRSHLVIFRYADPADVLKPLYLYGGIPLPQMILQRVYCAERTANEAPALALSKRTTVWLTNMAAIMADPQKAEELLTQWAMLRDNFGVKLGDKEGDQFEQFDTPLADFDQLVMTQYGLVAAIAGMPITRLLGTTPGGFAATGDYDESAYHEMLESMQERDLTPLADRHHDLVMRSEIIPQFPDLKGTEITIKWHELDAMTHVEQGALNLSKAQTGAALIAAGALTPEDERARVAADKESGYHGIGKDLEIEDLPEDEDPDAAAGASGNARRSVEAAQKEEQNA